MREERTWANERHIANQHVQQLWNFIESRGADCTANSGETLVFRNLSALPIVRRVVRAEIVEEKPTPIFGRFSVAKK